MLTRSGKLKTKTLKYLRDLEQISNLARTNYTSKQIMQMYPKVNKHLPLTQPCIKMSSWHQTHIFRKSCLGHASVIGSMTKAALPKLPLTKRTIAANPPTLHAGALTNCPDVVHGYRGTIPNEVCDAKNGTPGQATSKVERGRPKTWTGYHPNLNYFR